MAIAKLKPTIFVPFQDPASGEMEFADKERKRPIGVMIHSPGSVAAKKVESNIVQANLNRQTKRVTAEQIEASALGRLVGGTFEFVNFDGIPGYENKEYTPENARAFYTDPDYAHLREQVQDKITDFSAALTTTENS